MPFTNSQQQPVKIRIYKTHINSPPTLTKQTHQTGALNMRLKFTLRKSQQK
jgi:hypothetical protein